MKSIRKFSIVALCTLFIGGAACNTKAQTFSEWFRQKKTQEKYLLNQIAALQVYIGYAKQGYELVGSGLSTVKDITGGEFNLHNAFISGLKKVSPIVASDIRIAEIIAYQLEIARSFNALRKSGAFVNAHLGYIGLVAEGVLSACHNDLEELLQVITSGKLEMEDGKRIARIVTIHERMMDKAAFTQDFCNDAALLIRQKQIEQRSIENLRRYYEID
ncbi:hypothetical protein [Pedobacter helvus]|uniref:TerB family tellurite resistance protein n=1 Tax=Pedobacter helvus TaxID=2563444 RepID=A0ABW9JCT3_9SPHI|nr:hypothetical protein [Pedobacter ureilyticus]